MTGTRFDACLQLLANQQRRQIIQALRRGPDGTSSFDGLVDRISRESVADPHLDREQVSIQLHHSHLPRLADLGILEYDPERGMVQYTPDEQTEAVLDSLPDDVSVPTP